MGAVAGGIREVVGQLGGGTASAVAGDAVGHDGLASALEEFGGRWEPGLRCLVEDGNRFAGGLAECVAAYGGVEQKIVDSLRGPGS